MVRWHRTNLLFPFFGCQKVLYSRNRIQTQYKLNEFVEKSRTALNIASDRVKEAYGFPCSRALGQLKQIETKALEYKDLPEAKVLFIEFIE